MTTNAPLRCRCGNVTGHVVGASQRSVNRVVCYCDDCQAFAHHLGRADLLDAHGGTDIVQMAPSALKLERGTEHIAAVRLSPKGLYRFYAKCCNTPLGNTVGPAIPFIGVVAQAFERPDDAFGTPVGGILGKFAVGTPPAGTERVNLRLLIRAITKVLGWKLKGRTWPHPFFARGVAVPNYPVRVLTPTERDALQPLCGPHLAEADPA